jgi:hypothetical protein
MLSSSFWTNHEIFCRSTGILGCVVFDAGLRPTTRLHPIRHGHDGLQTDLVVGIL